MGSRDEFGICIMRIFRCIAGRLGTGLYGEQVANLWALNIIS